MTPRWEIEIRRDGLWPTVWTWIVTRDERGRDAGCGFEMRRGEALTKERARRKAVRAKRSMEEDDVAVAYPTGDGSTGFA